MSEEPNLAKVAALALVEARRWQDGKEDDIYLMAYIEGLLETAVEMERERCAILCEDEMAPWSSSSRATLAVQVLTSAAAAIRATP